MGGSSVSFPGVFMHAIYRLNACSGGTLMSSCSAVKLQGEIYGKVNQLIPHCQFYPGLLWEIRYLKSKAYPGPLHSSSIPLFLWGFFEVLSFTVFLMFQPRAICLLMFFLLIVSTLFLPQSWLTSLQVALLQEIPMPLPKTSVSFASSFFCCCSLLNTLRATSPN